MSSYESIYQGSEDVLMPKYYLSTGYQMALGERLGMATDPRTANQLGQVNAALNPGTKTIEVGAIQSQIMDSIPTHHLTEIKRLMKMSGATPSFHAPVIEASGIGEGGWSEETRLGAEQQLKSAFLRAHDLDPKGNINVTVHSTAGIPEMTSYIKEGDKERLQSVYVINPLDGKIGPIKPTDEFFPEGEEEFTGKPKEFDVKRVLKKINEDQWTGQLSEINRFADFGEGIINRIEKTVKKPELIDAIAKGDPSVIKDPSDAQMMKELQKELNHGQIYLRNAYREMKSLFDRAYANSEGDDKKKLTEFAKWAAPKISGGIENNLGAVNQLNEIIEKGLNALRGIETPKVWRPLNEFVVEKAAETFANVAQEAYQKYGDTAPILSIENPPAGGGLSRGEDLKKVVQETREKLAENLNKKGVSMGEANKIAEKMVGATWDVGHINMLRKKGYSEKDVVKETEKIAPFVKHVHLSDNFGLEHTELPMGMGNVPIKDMMKKLGEKGFEAKKIIEAGNWWQYFAEHGGGNPLRPSIEAFDSPVYGMKAGPYWSQTGSFPGYFSGQGPINPAVHHRVYGAGFEALPTELGGQIPGDQSRFSGAPNQ